MRSAGATVDVYPFGGGFRVSAGVRWNGNRGRVVASPGGFTFTPARIGTLRGRGITHDVAPAASLGFGSRPGRGFPRGVDAAALFGCRARVSPLTSITGMIPQGRLGRERDDLRHDVGKYKMFLIAQATIGWRS